MDYSKVFKALSDPIRLDILRELGKGEMNAGEIVDKFSLINSKVSYHLAILKKANLIQERKYKNFIFYSLRKEILKETSKWIDEIWDL